jgi:hypothetical protein
MTINSGDITIDLDGHFDSSGSQNGFEYAETTHVTLASVDLNITLAHDQLYRATRSDYR